MGTIHPLSFTKAVAAYRSARAIECLRQLDGLNESEAVILRARAHHRLIEPTLGIAALETIDPGSLPHASAKAEYFIVMASLHVMSGELERAADTLELARRAINVASSHAAEAEFHVVRSIFFFSSDNLVEADRAAENALHANLTLDRNLVDYFEPFSTSKARALNMRGLVSAGKQLYHEQGRFLRLAILELEAQPQTDVWMLANLLINLAYHCRDFYSEQYLQILEHQLSVADWPDELDRAKSEICAAIAHCYSLTGQYEDARRLYERSLELAPTDGWRITAGATLATFETEIGDVEAASETMRTWVDFASNAEINERTEERFALIDLAYVAASLNVHEARALLDRFKALNEPLSPVFNNSSDRRQYAYQLRAEATILLAEGSADQAIELYRKAFEIWYAIGIEWLAATVAYQLLVLTGEIRFKTYLRREVKLRPNSALAKRFAQYAT